MKVIQSRFWVTFGALTVKIAVFGSMLCLFTDQHIGNTFRCLCLIFLDDVTVKILCGGDAGVTQLLGYLWNRDVSYDEAFHEPSAAQGHLSSK